MVENTSEEKPKEKQIVEQMIATLDKSFREEKAKEIQNLYNALVDAISSQGAHISNILTAIELVKQEYINQKLQQIRAEQQQQQETGS
jgi:ABC-type transporter Mla subunit MlaD